MSDTESKTTLAIRFLGGAATVTGSKTLVEYGNDKILVDCGLFQGLKVLRLLNRQRPEYDAASISAVIITHAHLDHVGYLPLLVRNGYKGKIFMTGPTGELARIILLDSAKIHEEEARMANTGGYSKHAPATPLYTIKDAEESLKQFAIVDDEKWIELSDESAFCYHRNGHILGSCAVELRVGGKHIVFSGDLGRAHSPMLKPPVKIERADYLVLESTYGDRDHAPRPAELDLALVVTEALLGGGNLIIPTFAVERAQEIMFILNSLKGKNLIPSSVPIYLDSPMGIDVTDVYLKYPEWHTLSPESCNMIRNGTIRVRDFEETQVIIGQKHSKIIIAGSGMLSGGRALEYLKAYVGERNTTVLFVGYQAEGTRGRAMLNGATHIKIHGDYYRINAKIKEIQSFSGHADRTELLAWLGEFSIKPSRVFLNHGELKSSDALRKQIEEKFNIPCTVPLLNSKFEL